MIELNKRIIISLMGVDGSGKTTYAKKIIKIFKKSKYLHLKPYILFQDRRTTIKNPHHQKKSIFILSLFRLLSWLVSYKIFFNLNKKKKIYIFDRYAHDIFIDPLRYKHNLSQNLTKIILEFFPKPDLWIFLNPSIKTVKLRKLELSDIELRRQIKDYTDFFKKQNNVLELNTKIKKEILIKHIKKKINKIIK